MSEPVSLEVVSPDPQERLYWQRRLMRSVRDAVPEQPQHEAAKPAEKPA